VHDLRNPLVGNRLDAPRDSDHVGRGALAVALVSGACCTIAAYNDLLLAFGKISVEREEEVFLG